MNVVVIDIDSLRPDHIGAYGYEAPTTANIDAVAADGIRFSRAYVANSPCMPSRAAFLSGRYGIHNGVETHGPRGTQLFSPATRPDWEALAEDYRTLPAVFFHDRRYTAGISSFPRHPAPWFARLWHEFRQPQEPATPDTSAVPREDPEPMGLPGEGFQTPRAEDVANLAIDVLEGIDVTEEPFFLYAQFWDPHEPYNRTESEIEPFRDETPMPPHPTATQIENHQDWDMVRAAPDMNVRDREDLHELLARYDAEIQYVDRHIGRIVDALRRWNRYDETLLVITADHGEEFGEHGEYRHHWSTHDGTQRVPLIIKPPVAEPVEGGSTDELVTNVDLAPTLVDYAGLDRPDEWQGRSLRPAIEGTVHDWRDAVVVDHGLYMAQRALRTDRWKLIRTYHPGLWTDVTPAIQLFDMNDDPWEQADVFRTHRDVVEDLRKRMAVWIERHRGPEEDALRRVARVGPTGFHRFRAVGNDP